MVFVGKGQQRKSFRPLSTLCSQLDPANIQRQFMLVLCYSLKSIPNLSSSPWMRGAPR